MKKERLNTKVILVDIQFHESLNEFEYQYGDFTSYKQMEQKSYINFKELMFENICRDIKFRKFGRFGRILTIKAEMLKSEVEKFRFLLGKDQINIGYGWIISNVTIIKDNKINEQNSKFKKITSNNLDNDEEEDDENENEEELENFDEF
jgi:hypothetical protein